MKPQDVHQIIQQQRKLGLKGVMLTMKKRHGWRPSGARVRTPFGLGLIFNVFDKYGKTHVVFHVPISGLEKYLDRLEKAGIFSRHGTDDLRESVPPPDETL